MTSARLNDLFSTSKRTLFVPLTFKLSMALEQITWSELVTDPNLASFAIRATGDLFKVDALVNWFDEWMEAESFGVVVQRGDLGEGELADVDYSNRDVTETVASGMPCQHVLDVTKRLCTEVGPNTAVLGYLTGGATLLARLYGSDESRLILQEIDDGKLSSNRAEQMEVVIKASIDMVNAYCERGVGGILIVEHDPLETYAHLDLFAPLFNVCSYFGVPTLLLTRSVIPTETVKALEKLGISQAIGSENQVGRAHVITETELRDRKSSFTADAQTNEIVFTEWDLPVDTDPAALTEHRTTLIGP